MEEKESEVTKAVREAVVKAVEKGEDIKEKVDLRLLGTSLRRH